MFPNRPNTSAEIRTWTGALRAALCVSMHVHVGKRRCCCVASFRVRGIFRPYRRCSNSGCVAAGAGRLWLLVCSNACGSNDGETVTWKAVVTRSVNYCQRGLPWPRRIAASPSIQGLSVLKHILKIAALLVVASLLPGCGGGDEDLADTTRMASEHEPPGRGPEWLLPPSDEVAPSAG